MKRESSESDAEKPSTSGITGKGSKMAFEKTQKRVGKRPGRKPSKIDVKAKLERSRQSARECRARKKLRYQYLEELVASREKAVFSLRDEVEMYRRWCHDVDEGYVPDSLKEKILNEEDELSPLASPLARGSADLT